MQQTGVFDLQMEIYRKALVIRKILSQCHGMGPGESREAARLE
jgi:hypothetical protein